MVEFVNKFGVNWKCSKAKDNNLYLFEDENSYNTSKIWFMLVLDKNNVTQYLAFHRTDTKKDKIINHIKTSTYSNKQKLYELPNIEFNNNAKNNDYTEIFSNKELFAIPEKYVYVIEKIDSNLQQYISKVLNKNTEVNNYEVKKSNLPKKQRLNTILYGPPGTGKTYSTKFEINNIISQNTIRHNQITNLNEFEDLNWYSIIALAMYNHKKESYSVPDLKKLDEIKIALLTKSGNSLDSILWGQLQIHTSESNKLVKYEKRQAPLIFEKLENSRWKLNENGKMFVKEQLADYIEYSQNNTQKEYNKFITFHQSYSYEDFVEGIKPECNNEIISYKIKNGIFKDLCIKANSDPDNNYVLVIDEINRGNISKIFGELITLIEDDKRVEPNGEYGFDNTIEKNNQLLVTLPYSQRKFGVPKNLHILGTMNTSDRSIASIDIALRRRFKFKEMMPKADLVADFNCNFHEYFAVMNERISVLLDRDHQIGHSYFIKNTHQNDGIDELKDIWFDSILPLLNEYFYSDWEKLQALLGSAKVDNTSFIKKIEKITFANSYTCEDHENYDFVNFDDCNFIEAMKNAFGDSFEVK